MEEWKLMISGKVQGVGFRRSVYNFVKKNEKITGYVRNLDNGKVEILVQGREADLESLAEFCHRGSQTSEVHEVEIIKIKLVLNPHSKIYSNFTIASTIPTTTR